MPRSSGENPEKQLKIAILSPSAPPVSVGGIATAHFALFRGLQRRGFDVELLTFSDFGGARKHRDDDPKITRFGIPWWAAKGVQAIWKAWFFLLGGFRGGRFSARSYQTGDIWKSRVGARAANKRLRDTRPDVVIFPDQAAPAFWIEKQSGQRWIQICHHQPIRFLNQPEIGEHSIYDVLMALEMEKNQIQKSDLCIVPSFYMKGVVRSFLSPSIRCEVISNLIEEGFKFDRPANLPVNRIFIPSGGSQFKGANVVPDLIRKILGQTGSAPLEVFISGSLTRGQIDKIERAAPGVRLLAPGQLPHFEVLKELSCSCVCVSPTWIENQSMALLEAKSLSVPFVTFDVGGNRELLGEFDRVVPRGDVDALATAAAELILNPPEKRTRWDSAAHNENSLDKWVKMLIS